eukprot:EC719076.1.p1 GENE.EC719076.1~~EC719076.1.p1  ORF type:complete len:117 (+),score=4.28 EC719076.1:67-417(+)
MTHVPEEVLVEIFKNLTVTEIGHSMALVCKLWNEAAESAVLGGFLCSRDGIAQDTGEKTPSWKIYYRENTVTLTWNADHVCLRHFGVLYKGLNGGRTLSKVLSPRIITTGPTKREV